MYTTTFNVHVHQPMPHIWHWHSKRCLGGSCRVRRFVANSHKVTKPRDRLFQLMYRFKEGLETLTGACQDTYQTPPWAGNPISNLRVLIPVRSCDKTSSRTLKRRLGLCRSKCSWPVVDRRFSCVSIGSDSGLSPIWRQANIWNNVSIF